MSSTCSGNEEKRELFDDIYKQHRQTYRLFLDERSIYVE